MCDIQVRERESRWPRYYSCDRSGKHEIWVHRKNGDNEWERKIHVCGQHKNMLEKGNWLYINIDGNDVRVAAHITPLGEATRKLEDLKSQKKSCEWSRDVVKESLGKITATYAVELREAIKDNPELESVVLGLDKLLLARSRVLDIENQILDAEDEISRIKKGG